MGDAGSTFLGYVLSILSASATAAEKADNPDQNHRAENCHNKTVDIQAGQTCGAKEVFQDKAADERACDTADYVLDAAHLLVLAGDDAGDGGLAARLEAGVFRHPRARHRRQPALAARFALDAAR